MERRRSREKANMSGKSLESLVSRTVRGTGRHTPYSESEGSKTKAKY